MNPFVFGSVVDESHFIDREEEIQSITQSLLSGQHVICYSPRRYGKTSMLMRVKEELLAKRHDVFYIDLFKIASIEDLYNAYATSIIAAIQGPVKTLLSLIQRLLPAINPQIVIKNPDSPTVEISVPVPVLEKTTTLDQLFDSLEKYCTKKKKRGVVIFDEFQELATVKDGQHIEKLMRASFQHHRRVSYAFLGSKNHMMKKMFRDKNRPFYNFGRHFVLDVIGETHWQKHIHRYFGSALSNELLHRILELSECHPYYTQMICHFLWEKGKKSVSAKSLDEVIEGIIKRDSLLFAEMWEKLNAKQRQLCKAVAHEGPAALYEAGFLQKYSLGSASSVQKAVNKLLEIDYLARLESGEGKLINPMFRQWIIRR